MYRALSLLFLLTACRTVTQGLPPPKPEWEVPFTLEQNGLPLVQATIGGKQTLLIVDTGAPDLTLQNWFVKSLEGVEPAESEGRRVVELSLQLGAINAKKKWSLVETVPDQRELGIGGTLSPQKLLERGAIAIDFPNKRILAINGRQQSWMLWLDERSPRGQVEALPRTAPFGGALHVKTRVGDGKEVPTRLSSAQQQTAYAKDMFDPSLLAGSQHLAGLHIRTGDSEFGPVDVLVRDADAPIEGWLGLDVLRNVVLLVPVHEMAPIWLMTPR